MPKRFKNPLSSIANQFGVTVDSVLQPDFELHLGHVERVFPSSKEIKKSKVSLPSGDTSISQMISISPTTGILPSGRKKFTARPLLRGVSDSITRGDLVLYTSIAGKRFYLGPLNTINNPNYSPDHTYIGSVGDSDISSGYSKTFDFKDVPKLEKLPNLLDAFNTNMEVGSEQDLERKFTDMTLEGRHGNSIRIGSRREKPQIMISNQTYGGIESYADGSNISLTSIGSIKQNFGIFTLACDSVDDTNNPRKLFINHGNDPESQSDDIPVQNAFDYDYGNPVKPSWSDEKTNQIIMFSDRITFDAKRNDLTLSAYRNINLGAGKNFTLTNRGFSVIESNNIYIGKEAKNKAQPMVLGDELRILLLEIMTILQDSRALVQGVPIPLVDQKSAPMFDRIQRIIIELEARTLSGDPELPQPGPTKFLSQYHYVEQNVRP
jgi:hypothetical protein